VVAEKQTKPQSWFDGENLGMKAMATTFTHQSTYELAQRAGQLAQWPLYKMVISNKCHGRAREVDGDA
jgi:hypothetical protein